MNRRSLLTGAAALGMAGTTGLAHPAYSQAANRTLKFVPQANLANPDPVWTTTIVAANHAHMVWDQLWNFDEGLNPKPQMLSGVETSSDGLTWKLTLRGGQLWHDGEKVLAKDCVPPCCAG